jgi:hypothetical protein
VANGTEVVQVELTHNSGDGSTRHKVLWIEAVLRPVRGMVLVFGKDPQRWTVAQAYTSTPVLMEGINTGWKVGGL